ncbi:MAG: Tat (twin-arginine translocation) pathway signal sequence containing protein [Gemmatimonadales bacterium]
MSSDENTPPSARRTFLEKAALGTVALATAPLLASCAGAAPVAQAPADEEPWIKPLTGKHKQVFDAPVTNEGFPLIFAYAYIGTMTSALNLKPGEVSAIVIARHFGMPLALKDEIWAKYHLGELIKVNDPATKKPSLRNIFFNAKEGDMMMIEASAEKLIAQGVVIGVCNVALQKISGMLAAQMKLKPDDVYNEFKAGVIPGAHVVPSGVMAVGRAQEKGCSYCFAG